MRRKVSDEHVAFTLESVPDIAEESIFSSHGTKVRDVDYRFLTELDHMEAELAVYREEVGQGLMEGDLPVLPGTEMHEFADALLEPVIGANWVSQANSHAKCCLVGDDAGVVRSKQVRLFRPQLEEVQRGASVFVDDILGRGTLRWFAS
jgi:hypothetical protein